MDKKNLPAAKPEKPIERVYLNAKEYYGLRCLFGLVSEFTLTEKLLHKRMHMIPNGWRDFRLLSSMAEKLMARVLMTVPQDKLNQIARELRQTHVEVAVRATPTLRPGDGLTYVPEAALDRLTQKVIDWECFGCEKCGKEARRCQIRQDIEATYHFALPFKESCPFSEFHVDEYLKENDDNA